MSASVDEFDKLDEKFRKLPESVFKPYGTIGNREEDLKKIAEIINTMAMDGMLGPFKFIAKILALWRIGDELMGTHPYDYLHTIFNPALRSKTCHILNFSGPIKSIIKDRFISGIALGLSFSKKRGDLEGCSEVFLDREGVATEEARNCVRDSLWKELICILKARNEARA